MAYSLGPSVSCATEHRQTLASHAVHITVQNGTRTTSSAPRRRSQRSSLCRSNQTRAWRQSQSSSRLEQPSPARMQDVVFFHHQGHRGSCMTNVSTGSPWFRKHLYGSRWVLGRAWPSGEIGVNTKSNKATRIRVIGGKSKPVCYLMSASA